MQAVQFLCVLIAVTFVNGDGHGGKPAGTPQELTTNAGPIRGYFMTYGNLSGTTFKGIPYAQAPVGDLRFKRPQPMPKWSAVFDAKEMGANCVQIAEKANEKESEDCLFLNVYVPGDFATRMNTPKAVMVYIDGYGFSSRNSSIYTGMWLAAAHNVIVVTFNYRLGLFGFMSTEDGSVPGNMGFFDQHSVLMWVKNNIKEFGGDVNSVTIFGESTGAESVFHHLMSPASENLFHKAIIQSMPMIYSVKRKDQAGMLKSVLGEISEACKSNVKECVSKLTTDQIRMAGLVAQFMYYPFVVVDGTFIQVDPIERVMSGNFSTKKPVIVGYSSDDGADTVKYAMYRAMIDKMKGHEEHGHEHEMPDMKTIEAKWSRIMAGEGISKETDLKELFGYALFFHGWMEMPNAHMMGHLLYQQYLSCAESPVQRVRGVMDMFTDALFSSTALKFASIYSMYGGNVYLYEFQHLTMAFKQKMPMMPARELELRATHGTQFMYTFLMVYQWQEEGWPILDAELRLADSFSYALSEFAKTGNPIFVTNNLQPIMWKPYSSKYSEMMYVQFSGEMKAESFTKVPGKLMKRAKMWNYILPGIQGMETCDPFRPMPEPPVSKGATLSIMSMVNMLIVALAVLFVPRKM